MKEVYSRYNSQEREKNLKNAKEVVAKFKERVNIEVRRQEKIDIEKKKEFGRGELPGRYMTKMLYSWNDGKFGEEYLRKLERNW